MKSLFLIVTIVQVFAKLDISNYQLVFNQDFTQGKNLSASGYGPLGTGVNDSTWMCHTNFGKDYMYMLNPQGNYVPFSTDDDKLTIRTQVLTIDGKKQLTTGLLNSMDDQGRGFAQKWGYFEAKAWLPNQAGTWPAFWLLDGTFNASNDRPDGYGVEIDIFEQYGTPTLYTTLHYWSSTSTPSAGKGYYSTQCDMMTGYHTYGLDYQADYLTFYYDRVETHRIPNNFSVMGTGLTGSWDRPMYILINNGYSNTSDAFVNSVVGNPFDMYIEYVKVWAGTGGSDGVSNYNTTANSVSWGWDGTSITTSNPYRINGVTLEINSTGSLRVVDRANNVLWASNSNHDCGAGHNCYTTFQGDGNWVMYDNGSAFYGTSTYGLNAIGLIFQNTQPYLYMVDGDCKLVWNATNTIASPLGPPLPTTTTTSTSSGATPTSTSASHTTMSSTSSGATTRGTSLSSTSDNTSSASNIYTVAIAIVGVIASVLAL